MRKPITQKAKSPLKQTSAGDVLMESTTKTPDVTVKGTKGTPEKRRTILYSDLPPEQREAARAHNMKKFGTHNPTAEGLANNTVVTEAATPGTPDKVIPGETKTETYAPKIKREGDAITPWENRWNRRVEKANRRWDRQDAKQALRAEARQDARDVRQSGGTWAEGWKARRDLMTGRGELSDSERDLYDKSRKRGNDKGTYASEQRRTLASGDDKVTVYEDLEIKDAGTSEGERTLDTYGRTIGGKPTFKQGSEVPATNKVNGTGAANKSSKAPSETLNLKPKSASISSSKGANKLAPVSLTKPSSSGNFAGTGMSATEVSDLSEAMADREAAGKREANKFTGSSIKANTGTANRSSYDRTSPGLSDGTPVREDSDRSVLSAAQMRYSQNVGFKSKAPLKKGYFK